MNNRTARDYHDQQQGERARRNIRQEKRRRIRRRRMCIRLMFTAVGFLLSAFLIYELIIKVAHIEPKSSISKLEVASVELKQDSITQLAEEINFRAALTRYYTYGTHFNLEGTMTYDSSDEISSMRLIFCTDSETKELSSGIELSFNTFAQTISFETSSEINSGVDLEAIQAGTYYLLLEMTDYTGKTSYAMLKDESQESAIVYYTITDPVDASNRKINIENRIDGLGNSCFVLEASPCELPEDVYDIVIDPGHGGTDGGAVYGYYTEADLVLQCALKLYDQLTQAGYKVLLTRDGTEALDTEMDVTMYDEDGRVNVSCASKAKYAVSLHLNSNDYDTDGGVQIYCSTRGNTEYAAGIASSLVETAQTTYSTMETGAVASGVYMNAFTQYDIQVSVEDAQSEGYTPYDITTDTDYYYMIRELGGIATNAYVDGRNLDYGANRYVSSNQGVESCLCELGFLSEAVDRNNLINHMDSYASALANAIIAQCQ